MRKLIVIILLLSVVMIGCSSNEEEVTDDDERSGNNGENRYPLSGLYTDDPIDHRIISVMVNNHNDARPQSGLSKADIVFEILAEAGITRLLALYQSEIPDVVGPVRSAREYYFDLADGYEALYVYHGAAGFINDMIVNRGIPYLNGATHDNDGRLFKREDTRQAPHNSYVQMKSVYGVSEEKGYPTAMDYEELPFLNEEELDSLEGEELERIEIVYNSSPQQNVEYMYNESSGDFLRYSNGVQTTDLETDEEVMVDNILIMETYHEVIDDQGRRAVDIDSGGAAYLLQKGTIQEIEWQNENGRIIPVKDGEEVGLVPGKTWINVVPDLDEYVTVTMEISE